jgi:predicted metal-dependent peptidase
VRRAAAKAASLGALREQMAKVSQNTEEPQRGEALMQAVRQAYDAPWERAVQRWIDAVAPGERTYMRPSRRRPAHSDIVLAGRRREGWMLHILLDTSGSMVDILPKALGAIGYFAEGAGVTEVHLVQCDVVVTNDDWIEPERLDQYRIRGFGYSDMTPGFQHLNDDPEISAVLVLTDGYIDFPAEEPPYRVLWALIGECSDEFRPSYGDVVRMRMQ